MVLRNVEVDKTMFSLCKSPADNSTYTKQQFTKPQGVDSANPKYNGYVKLPHNQRVATETGDGGATSSTADSNEAQLGFKVNKLANSHNQ